MHSAVTALLERLAFVFSWSEKTFDAPLSVSLDTVTPGKDPTAVEMVPVSTVPEVRGRKGSASGAAGKASAVA